jgi:outer membrane receptor protein involved in Fe transport
MPNLFRFPLGRVPAATVLLLTGLFVAAATAAPAASEAAKAFDVPAGAASRTLRVFAQQAGREIVFSAENIGTATTNAIRGDLTPREALDRMTVGTGLVVGFDEKSGLFSVRKDTSVPTGPRAESSDRPASGGAVASQARETAGDGVVTLNALNVYESREVGWGALNSSSSSRLNLALLDVPQTVSVVTADFLRDMMIFDSRHFVEYVNSVSPRANAHQTEVFYSRGLQISNSYVNGFQSSMPLNRDMAFYDRIEYVKGPASAAVGRGEAGGIINYVEKAATFRNRTTVQLTLGTDEFRRTDIDYNTPLGRGRNKAVRLVGYYQASNSPRGGELNQMEKMGIMGAFRWDLTARTNLAFNLSLYKHHNEGASGNATWQDKYVWRDSVAIGFVPANNEWRPGPTTPFLPQDQIFTFRGAMRPNEQAAVTTIVTHAFSDNLNYRQGFRFDRGIDRERRWNHTFGVNRDRNDPTQWLLPLLFVQNDNRANGARAQGDLLYNFTALRGRHDFLVGYEGYTTYRKDLRRQTTGFFYNLYNPRYDWPAGFDSTTSPRVVDTETGSKGYSYYGQFRTSFFDDRLSAIVGWRKDTSISRASRNNLTNTSAPGGTKQVTDAPRYSVTFKPVKSVSLYFLHTEQSDPPVNSLKYNNFLAGNGATIPPLTDPRRTDRIQSQVLATMEEVGVKSELFDRRLTVSVAYFDLKRDGFLQNRVIVGPGFNGLGTLQYNELYAASGEHVKGVEVEVYGVIRDRLTFFAGYARMSGSAGYANNAVGPIESLIPSLTGHLKYDFRGAERNGFVVTGGGKVFFGGWTLSRHVASLTYGADQFKLDGGVAYHFQKGRANVNLRVNNVTDEFVIVAPAAAYPQRRAYLSYTQTF